MSDKSKGSDSDSGDDKKKGKKEPEEEVLEIPRVDNDLLDILQGYDENTENLKKLMNKKERLNISEIIVWKDKADDIIGEELDHFVNFMQTTYLKKKTKYSFSMKELRDAICSWVKYENMKRHDGLDTQTKTETETVDAISIV